MHFTLTLKGRTKPESGQFRGRPSSSEDVEEGEVSPVRLHEIRQEADRPGDPLIQAVRGVGVPGLAEFGGLRELREPQGPVQVRVVVRQTVEQEEDEPASCDAVADAGSFAEQTSLPRQFAAPHAGVQVTVVFEVEKRLRKHVHYAWRTVAPVHEFVFFGSRVFNLVHRRRDVSVSLHQTHQEVYAVLDVTLSTRL